MSKKNIFKKTIDGMNDEIEKKNEIIILMINGYSRKSVEKYSARLQEVMKRDLPDLLSGIGIKYHNKEQIRCRDLKKLQKKV